MESNKHPYPNAERFLSAYARVESSLFKLARESHYIPFSQLLNRCAKESAVVSRRQNDLREYHELRNAIVHTRGKENEIIAEPCLSVTEDIEHIAYLLEHDRNIMGFVTSPVRIVHPEDSIHYVYALMEKMHTSKLLVYDKQKYCGIVTLEEVAAWAMQEHPKDAPVKDIMTSKKNERVLFLRSNVNVQVALRGFDKALNHGAVLLAVIITDHGNADEEPKGIITVADLPRIIGELS